MYYGIEWCTDNRVSRVTIRRFQRRSLAVKWLCDLANGAFAFPGAARPDIPKWRQNWHRLIREVYEMPRGFRLCDEERRLKRKLGAGSRGELQARCIRSVGIREIVKGE